MHEDHQDKMVTAANPDGGYDLGNGRTHPEIGTVKPTQNLRPCAAS